MKSREDTPKPFYRKTWFKILAITIGVIGAIYVWQELQWRGGYSVVYNQVDKIGKEILEPAGGIITGSGASRGATPLDIGNCMDVACPQVSRSWNVPIEPGKEKEFIENIFKQEGYSVGSGDYFDCTQKPENPCNAAASKGNLELTISIGHSQNPPTHDVTPKVWHGVGITVLPVKVGQPLP